MNDPLKFEINDLLLPLKDKVGAIKKGEKLIDELSFQNIDWKTVVAELRTYLFDYMYDILPYADRVTPIIFSYLNSATLRKKNSAIRACDTFFNRYIFIINKIHEGDKNFEKINELFNSFCDKYFDLIISESRDDFYFGNVNNLIIKFGDTLIKIDEKNDIIKKINEFIFLQYRIYTKNIIKTTKKEIKDISSLLEGLSIKDEIFELLTNISEKSYNNRFSEIKKHLNKKSEALIEIFNQEKILFDFYHNSKNLEKLCLKIKNSINNGLIEDDETIIKLLTFLIKKSNEGDNKEMQLLISRTVASVCSFLVSNNKFETLKKIVALVMPILQAEIENGGNYYSAFSTIYNIGKIIIKSCDLSITDYFVDILIKSKFCFPQFSGIAADWSVIVNSSHLENIRTWMKLIELDPPVMKKLVASLIVNLKLGGAFLKDTDVFQRDISKLLKSNYKDVFYMVISLAAVFPAFYHDIGATGDIRAFTEKIDTNHQMYDLIHFIRKQVHVESSSRTVLLLQKIMEFWLTGDKELIKNMVPEEVYDRLDDLFRLINLDLEKAPNIIVNETKKYFKKHSNELFWDFLNSVDEEQFLEYVDNNEFDGVSKKEKESAYIYFRGYFRTKIPTEMTKILNYIKDLSGVDISKTKIWKMLYEISDDNFRKIFEVVRQCDISHVNIEKFITFLHVYRMLFDKYNFSEIRAIEKLETYAAENLFKSPENFFEVMRGDNNKKALSMLLDLQCSLKNEILLSGKNYEPVDTIEFKRHIAFGIPSMYGSYKEKKFDTLKVFFQLNLVRLRLFEKIIENYHNFTKGDIDYEDLKTVLNLFFRTFLVDGLANQEMVVISDLLDTPDMMLSQLRDMINHLLTIHGEISDRFNKAYKYVCKRAIDNIGLESIIKKFHPYDKPENIEIIMDRFLRDQIMQSPTLQHFDNLLLELRDYLISEIEKKGDSPCLNIGKSVKSDRGFIHEIKKFPEKMDDTKMHLPIWDIGGKAYNLLFARNIDGINVPRGFILSPYLFEWISEGNINNYRFKEKVISHLKEYVDNFTNNRFANSENPVLFSVRSGAVFSMPGVMDTITNVGITQGILDSFSKKDAWFAYDCYRRLIQDFAISLNDMDRRIFEKLMKEAKQGADVSLKENLTGEQMKALTEKYKYAVNDYAFSIPKDPYAQLLYAIIAVFKSWDSTIAKTYRKFVNISDVWGTSVIIQEMVFGNNTPSSITGVVHSLYINYERFGLFGEYKTRAQGYDIVSGVAKIFPISEEQKQTQKKLSTYPSLENSYPGIYKKLYDAVKIIRDKWQNDVEIEFTVQDQELYILQIRGINKTIFDVDELVGRPEVPQKYFLGQGLAASGGAVSGRAVYDIERINYMRATYKDDKIILIRPETNPEDVIGLKNSDGILTCIGGMTSHAVLQMRRLEKSGVSDFSLMRIDESNNFAVVICESGEKELIIKEADFITIDGHTGHVYSGYHKTRPKKNNKNLK